MRTGHQKGLIQHPGRLEICSSLTHRASFSKKIPATIIVVSSVLVSLSDTQQASTQDAQLRKAYLVTGERIVKLADVLILPPVRYSVNDPPVVLVAHILWQLRDCDDPDVISQGGSKVLQVEDRRKVAAEIEGWAVSTGVSWSRAFSELDCQPCDCGGCLA